MNTVELFSGTKSFSKVAKQHGFNTFTVDIDSNLEPDLVCDILNFDISMIPFDKVDILWMSPPCTTFSVASLSHYWIKGKPKNEKTLLGIRLVLKAIEIKDALLKLNPKMIWYIENPRGMLRKQDFMRCFSRKTISYCQYGDEVQKPTDIWTNNLSWNPKPMCSPGDLCHKRAKRGSDNGTQSRGGNGKYGWIGRTSIPPALFDELFKTKNDIKQVKLIEVFC